MLAMNSNYSDVFEETIKYSSGAIQSSLSLPLILILSSLFIGFWLLSGMAGFPNLPVKVHNVVAYIVVGFVVSLALGGTVLGFANVIGATSDVNKLNEVKSHMEENVAKKYNATLKLSLDEIPLAQDRDKPHDYTLVLNADDKDKRSEQRYAIRFDRETNEPFISDTTAPKAAELETK
jgi:hypothetical protein